MATKSAFPSEISIMGIGKDVLRLVGFHTDGKIVLHEMIKRLAPVPTFEKLPRCIVSVEAYKTDAGRFRNRLASRLRLAEW